MCRKAALRHTRSKVEAILANVDACRRDRVFFLCVSFDILQVKQKNKINFVFLPILHLTVEQRTRSFCR